MKFFNQTFLNKYLKNSPIILVDVGSSGGTKFPWKDKSDLISIVNFEPNVENNLESKEKLSSEQVKSNVIFTGNVALSDFKGTGNLFVTNHPDNSSLLKPNNQLMDQFAVSDRYVVSEKKSVSVDTLDNQLKLANINEIDFIKIDTQGSELSVLHGAGDFLTNVLGLEVEINFTKRYSNQSFFSDIDEFLRERGFVLFDIERRFFKRIPGLSLGGPKGQITHGNALYFREEKYFEELVNRDGFNKAKLIKFIFIILFYGYCDYAIHILNKFEKQLSKEDYKSIIFIIEKHNRDISNLLPIFPGRGVLYNTLNFIKELLRINSPRGNFGDKGLGNYRIK